MKHKVSELEGALLDAAVAKAQDAGPTGEADWVHYVSLDFAPSTDGRHGVPIIERERIIVFPSSSRERAWAAFRARGYSVSGGERFQADPVVGDVVITFDGTYDRSRGATPLIAAMRCYVAGKFGEEVELP